jgi:methylmalonyl-CoA carboxyltransferase 5S subunit
MLDGTGFFAKLDMARVLRIKDHFAKVRPRYAEFLSNITGVDTAIFESQIPGGMISNMESQLRQQGAADRMHEVLAEVPRVRADAGYPPLVTPTSQIVGTQAVFNVLMGRYKVITAEFADLMLGYYGATPAEKNAEVTQQAAATSSRKPITVRPADLLKPEWDDLRSAALALPGCNGSDEDVLTQAMFPQVAPKFFGTRKDGPRNLGKPKAPVSPSPAPHVATGAEVAGHPAGGANGGVAHYVVTLNGATHNVSVTPVES